MPTAESRRARVGCPWCGYDVSWLPKGNVCPECGGRQSASDFSFAAQQERDSWRGMWLLVLLAPGVGLWAGAIMSYVSGGGTSVYTPIAPAGAWAVTTATLSMSRLNEKRVIAPSVRRVQFRIFAIASVISLTLAIGLGLAAANVAAITAWAGTWSVTAGRGTMYFVGGVIGMAMGVMWVLPIRRVHRAWGSD